MTTDQRHVQAITPGGAVVDCVFLATLNPPFGWEVRLEGLSAVIASTNENLFDAIVEIREHLDGRGVKLLCNGARYNAVCVGFCRGDVKLQMQQS